MSEHKKAVPSAATDKTASAKTSSETSVTHATQNSKNNFHGGGDPAAPGVAGHYFAIDGEALMGMDLPPIQFVVDDLLTPGLYILAGGPKAGKSWMMLQFSLNIVQGNPIWGFQTNGKSVLYMCLEDSYRRIRRRIDQQDETATRKLQFLNSSPLLRDGLETVIDRHVWMFPDTKLVIIDTFQMVRGNGDGGSYGNDYSDVRELKLLADKLGITILLVHHLRKKKDDDPFNMISGTTGLTGAADGSLVLFRAKGSHNQFKLAVTGRDIEQKVLTLEFDPDACQWEMLDCDMSASMTDKKPPEVVFAVCDFVKSSGVFEGSATELLEAMGDDKTPVNTLTKALNEHQNILLDNSIAYEHHRSNKKKLIALAYCA